MQPSSGLVTPDKVAFKKNTVHLCDFFINFFLPISGGPQPLRRPRWQRFCGGYYAF
jgi:hypothetical protein